MISITYRITGLMFLVVALTVFLLVYLANQQMAGLFGDYLAKLHGNIDLFKMHGSMMGETEQEFLASVHQSLIWVGAGIMLAGLAASFALARSITVPLRKLNAAVREIEKGNFEERVSVATNDEVEQLAAAFNRMSQTLATNNHLRKQFLADIAHELRTPLAIIQGNLEGMIEGVIEPDKEQLVSLHEETLHLNRLIKDLRDLSLAEAGQLTLEKQPVRLCQLIARAVGAVKPLADEKAISLEYDLQPGPAVEADGNRINQVVYNLLTNAIRYTPPGGRVTVSCVPAVVRGTRWLRFSVCDTGEGIAEQDLPHVFDHFYRADKSRTRQSGGSGIGLSIVRQLVEIHGGWVEARSKLGAGSCFDVYLPVSGGSPGPVPRP